MAELEEDLTQDKMTPEQERALLGGFGSTRSKKGESRKAARQARHKQLSRMPDGRSLRQTRGAQLNIRTHEAIRDAVKCHCESRKVSVTEWLEDAIKAKLELEGYSDDA